VVFSQLSFFKHASLVNIFHKTGGFGNIVFFMQKRAITIKGSALTRFWNIVFYVKSSIEQRNDNLFFKKYPNNADIL